MDDVSAPVPTPSLNSTNVAPLETLEVDDLADVFICLRGPCEHYIETLEPAAVHNPEEGLLARSRTCLLLKSDLTEGTVLDCNRWEPMSGSGISDARDMYWKDHPQHDPRTADTVRLSQIRRNK